MPNSTNRQTPIERLLPYITLALMVLTAVYLVTYTQGQRERADCQERVNAAVIGSLTAGRAATAIETAAMDHLLTGLLSPGDTDAEQLLRVYQGERDEAGRLRVDNPLPAPTCN